MKRSPRRRSVADEKAKANVTVRPRRKIRLKRSLLLCLFRTQPKIRKKQKRGSEKPAKSLMTLMARYDLLTPFSLDGYTNTMCSLPRFVAYQRTVQLLFLPPIHHLMTSPSRY